MRKGLKKIIKLALIGLAIKGGILLMQSDSPKKIIDENYRKLENNQYKTINVKNKELPHNSCKEDYQ